MSAVAKRTVTSIETYTGKFVDLLDPKPEQICLVDIAVGLAEAPRFGGQINRHYSVAEHSVRVADSLQQISYGLQIYGLLHDAHEAYTNDITAPMKHVLELAAPGVIRDLQGRLDVAIADHFGLEPLNEFQLADIKRADDLVLFREAAGLKYSHGIGEHWGNDTYYEPLAAYGWSRDEAERRFIESYERLRNDH